MMMLSSNVTSSALLACSNTIFEGPSCSAMASTSLPATAIAVVIQRSSKNPQQIQVAVSAQIPRKRTSADDPICHKLQYWSFWDDKRNVSLLDALLTRLAPLSVIHLACTERSEVS